MDPQFFAKGNDIEGRLTENLLAKVPKHAHDQVKKDFWVIWNGIEQDAGEAAVLEAEKRVKTFSAKWKKLYPTAVSCLEDDLGHLTTYLRFPKEHWARIRHSNFISVNRLPRAPESVAA